MIDKNEARLRRARRTRSKIALAAAVRLTVHRTPRHMYAQLLDVSGRRTLASASTLDPALKKTLKKGTGNVVAAAAVGRLIAERGKAAGIEAVAFDRAGYRYHGRVRALAEAAREAGLKF